MLRSHFAWPSSASTEAWTKLSDKPPECWVNGSSPPIALVKFGQTKHVTAVCKIDILSFAQHLLDLSFESFWKSALIPFVKFGVWTSNSQRVWQCAVWGWQCVVQCAVFRLKSLIHGSSHPAARTQWVLDPPLLISMRTSNDQDSCGFFRVKCGKEYED